MVKWLNCYIVILLNCLIVFLLLASPAFAAVGENEVYRLKEAGESKILGKQTAANLLPFAFTVSDLIVDFGLLVPDAPATRSSQLTITTGSAGGYQVLAYEDHPLKIPDADKTIPDISASGGYGFGFKISGNDVDVPSDDYRPFPAVSLAKTAQPIMSQAVASDNPLSQIRKATVTYLVKISPEQPAGRYENTVTYIAVPKY